MKKITLDRSKFDLFLQFCVEFIIIFSFLSSIITCILGLYKYSFLCVILLIYHSFIYLSDAIYQLSKSSGKKSADQKEV